jgi:hypothetical protein
MPWSLERQSASRSQLTISKTASTPSYTETPKNKHLEGSDLLQWAAGISWLAAVRYWPELSLHHFENASACFHLFQHSESDGACAYCASA